MFIKARRALLAVLLTVGCFGGVAASVAATTASAGSQRFIDYDYADWTGRFGAAVPLWLVTDGPDFVGYTTCAGAYDVPTAAWAGTTVCMLNGASHSYCSCGSREGWGGGGQGTLQIHQTADELW